MQPESEQPKNPQPSKGYFRRAAERLFDHWFEWAGIKSAGDDMKDHVATVEKKGRILASAAIVAILSIIGGCTLRGCHDEDEIFTSNSLASSNAVVAKIFESQAESASQKDTADKIDAAEVQREKDAEIANLKTENASLHSQVATFQAAHVMEFSTNFDGSISNILNSAEYPEANIILAINDFTNLQPVDLVVGKTNIPNDILVLTTNRDIRFRLFNTAKYPATHAYVSIVGNIDSTNLFCPGWIPQPVLNTAYHHWRYNADESIAKNTYWDISTIQISTNSQKTFTLQIEVGADNAENKGYVVGFLIPK